MIRPSIPRPAALAMRPLARGSAVLTTIALAACGGDARASGPAVRDSAGIRIVQNARPAWGRGEGWTVAAEPVLDLGVAEGDPRYQFGAVGDAVRLSDGTLVVADGQANELRAYDAQGRWLRTLGRQGSGPGEFNGLGSVFLLPGDSIAAYDGGAGRLTVFAPSGALARTANVAPLDGRLPPKPLGAFADGSLVVAPAFNPMFTASPKPSRDTMPLARYSAHGAQAGSLGRIAGEETVTIVGGSGEDRFATRGPVPFGRGTHVAVAGTRLLIADNARYELAEHGADGRLVRLVRRAADPEPVTDADRAAWAEQQRQGASGRFRQMRERLTAAMPFPEHKSWFAGVRLDAAGNAWVQRHAAPDAGTPWEVFDAEGRLLGTVTTPTGLRVTQIGADFVVGVWKDELDVAHVRVHRLRKPAPR
jgi:hypothetical protein